MLRCVLVLCAASVAWVGSARAALTVLVGEPFGNFGTMMPTGHVSLYLDRVCADGPVKLRMCRPDERQGVVLARLNAIGTLDWIASPVLPFLYGVDDPGQVLTYATAGDLRELQQSYRAKNLLSIFPDGTEKLSRNNEWWETVGAAYMRRLWGYQIATTPEQDEQFVARMNAAPNRHLYHLRKTNCADFIADAVNFYYPGTVKVNKVADFGLMTPKQVARSVEAYGDSHLDAELKIFEVPQLPGTLRRSRPLRGGTDMLLKTKRYVATLLIIQPEAVLAMWLMYLHDGRWQIGRGSEVAGPGTFAEGPERSLATH